MRVLDREETVLVEERGTAQALGWSALTPPYRFTLTATALVETEVLALPRPALFAFFDRHPQVGYVVARNVAAIIGQRLEIFQAMWLREMQRVGKEHRYLCVESYRNEAEKTNLLANGSFEAPVTNGPATSTATVAPLAPDKWLGFARDVDSVNLTVSARQSTAGRQAAHLRSNKVANSFHGMGQVIPVQKGSTYRFAVQARNDPADKMQGTTRAQISIEWQDASGREIDRTWGPDFGPSLSPDQWKAFEMTGKAPAGAARAHFVVTMHEGDQPGGGGVYIDNATVSELP